MARSAAAVDLINYIRSHPGLQDLIAEIPPPTIPVFRKSSAEKTEEARAMWIFASGKKAQHEHWLGLLTGKIPQDAE